ncbi:trafficking protein particle complex subunit 10 [Anthonomus grandis grandis]|uniref:trafficking protein particle complex subunit 10 n=1 Tax=Anthonomus grandis grandis TaxID=2921223 RepID=UPI00216530E3|nr:trafficking protein particle complex subunit 10 [Anthonomus grandis grandis]
MNGTLGEEQGCGIDRRPIVTCAGELEVFSAIEDNLSQALPKDACEWKRSLGRPIKMVHIGARFVPFSGNSLPKPGQWDLIRQPLFHTYWTECSDVDVYKSSVREDIENWLKELASKDISDWLIVVVENYDGKRSKQLIPRTTVLDKIRADFALKQGDRCISVINPGKPENKSADSWRGLVGRMRHLLLVSYAKAVTRLEDHVRQQRERRNDPGWSFLKYFMLQEELAQVLEMLGIPDEALVQYDELDALFSQFVANFSTCDNLKWLSQFQRPLERWYGLRLTPTLLEDNPSLLELRAYIFSKQAQMLLLTNKVWEMASRCIPFLHTCVKELNILEITAPPGAVSCWLFLASMEVLQYCDRYNQADQVEEYSRHTAALWEYASQKLRNLGELCGLMPQSTPTSEQLHIVVSLSAGMGDNPGPPKNPSPTDRLKEALCSQEVFIKTYLELAELAMGTFKHVGRLRMARLVGKQVANFYLLLGETQKTAAFLGDAVRTFEQDGWHELAANTQILLADCHKRASDWRRYVKSCAAVCAALEMDTLIRWTYFDEMSRYLDKLEKPLEVPFKGIIRINRLRIVSDLVVMQNCNIEVELCLESNFPKEVLCSRVAVSLEKEEKVKAHSGHSLSNKDLKWQDPLLQRLKIKKTLDVKQDKQLATSGIASRLTILHRKDSQPANNKTDFTTNTLEVENLPLLLTPGLNLIKLTKKAVDLGKFSLNSVVIHVKNLRLLSPSLSPRLTLEVQEEGPSIRLYKRTAPLLCGIEQLMNLILTIGSYEIEPSAKIKLTTSQGLAIQTDPEAPLTNNLEVDVGDKATFSSTKMPLRILADLLTKDHQVTIQVPWNPKPIVVPLSFSSPLSTTWRLLTVNDRKFVQINVVGHSVDSLLVQSPSLRIKEVAVQAKHCDSSLIISNGLSYSFLWELILTKFRGNVAKVEFSLQYKLTEGDAFKAYQYYFDICDFRTLYILDATVEKAKGNEFCRVGVVCHLNLTISTLPEQEEDNPEEIRSIMYEVLAEQSVWAVCGRTAGVICFNGQSDCVQQVVLEVMPLTSGFLPLPLVRISKYIPAESATDKTRMDTHPRLEPFSTGQVYNKCKGKQLHVIGAANEVNP